MSESKPYVLVVGVDYSEPATLAFEQALQLAGDFFLIQAAGGRSAKVQK